MRGRRTCAARRGSLSIMAMLLLTVLASMAVTYASLSNGNLLSASNQEATQSARMEAEGGLSFCARLVRAMQLPPAATGQELLDAMAADLASSLNGTGNLAGGAIAYDGSVVTIPEIARCDAARGFSAQLYLVNDTTPCLVVTGRKGSVTRAVAMSFQLVPGNRSAGFFDYGIASKGPIKFTGNASVEGVSDPAEAQVLSATYSQTTAIDLTGNADMQGDLCIENPHGEVSMAGNVTVAGISHRDDEVWDHIHVGAEPTEFPEVDPTIFEPFATNIVDAGTQTSGNKTFSNIRIRANTNPTFSGNITLNGVIFIEQPNQVHFSGNVTITGVIVTEDAGDGAHDVNTIKFTGNTVSRGVEELPDTPEFSDLRQMPGSFLLAPGFGVQFTGNFGTVNGTMAADEFKFAGNAGGTIRGSLINYGDTELKMTGNSCLRIDRAGTPEEPPGFSIPEAPSTLSPSPDSYHEY